MQYESKEGNTFPKEESYFTKTEKIFQKKPEKSSENELHPNEIVPLGILIAILAFAFIQRIFNALDGTTSSGGSGSSGTSDSQQKSYDENEARRKSEESARDEQNRKSYWDRNHGGAGPP